MIDGVPLFYLQPGRHGHRREPQKGRRSLGFVSTTPSMTDIRLTFPASEREQRFKVVLWAGRKPRCLSSRPR